MALKGSANFGPRGSTALGFGGHAHRAFPDNKEIKKSAYSYDFNCKSGEESVSLKTSKLGVRAIAQF